MCGGVLPIQSELAGDAGADRASKIKKGMPAGLACLAFSKEAAGRTQGLGAATISTCPSPTAYKGSQTSFFLWVTGMLMIGLLSLLCLLSLLSCLRNLTGLIRQTVLGENFKERPLFVIVLLFKAAAERRKMEREAWSHFRWDHVYSQQGSILPPTCADG